MRAAWIGLALVVASCAAQRPERPPVEVADAMRREAPAYAVVHAAAAVKPQPLHVREQGLDGLALGTPQAQIQRAWGAPDRTRDADEGTWWTYDPQEGRQRRGRLELLFAGERQELAQVRAWAPSLLETRTMIRPLDPASRLARKYGGSGTVLPWGRGEAWLYPSANVGYVLTPAVGEEPRLVAGVIVGL